MIRTRSFEIPMISAFLFAVSEIVLIYYGLARVYFFFIIPVFVSTSPLSVVPFLLLLLPFMLAFISVSRHREEDQWTERSPQDRTMPSSENPKRDVNYGGFIMIGPVPILFGNRVSKSLLYILMALMVIIMALFIIFSR